MATWKPSASSLARMVAAWVALDIAARQAGARSRSCLPTSGKSASMDGTVAAIAKTNEEAHAIAGDRPLRWAVYTLGGGNPAASSSPTTPPVARAKLSFPGATVEAVRKPSDPLDRFPDTARGLDDPIEDLFPDFGA